MDDRENEITMHITEPEKPDAEETSTEIQNDEQKASESVQNHNYGVDYDAFMYEPIGFEELEKKQPETESGSESVIKKKIKRTK